jgi:sulfoxide reductase heme-binding subunit YedZ
LRDTLPFNGYGEQVATLYEGMDLRRYFWGPFWQGRSFIMKNVRFSKVVLFVNALVPLVLLLWDVYHKQVGANPLEFVTRTTGMLTLVFLFLSLSITPLRKITGANWLVKFRRMLGLFAFFYGFLHLMTYISFDRGFNLKSVPSDVTKRPFIAIGILTFSLLVPLAVTSTNKMVKRLGGKRWNRLHRLVYLAAIGGVVHFWMLVKSDTRLPLTFAFILALLLGYRILMRYSPATSRPATLFPER